MEFTDNLNRAEWDKDDIIERATVLKNDIREIIKNMDNSSYEGSPEDKSLVIINSDGTMSVSNSDSYIDESGNLVLN